ncbi:MAG: cupin domain-containing protein [Nonomuraea sp.]|nr:cupin domain-containing protein [Nonomuraea sp.]
MPVISGATAPTFEVPGVTATGLAAPSRGSTETCMWRFTMDPDVEPTVHQVDREEIFVLLSGRAEATVAGEEHLLGPGDALVVPAHTTFSLINPGDEPLELVAVLPVGGRAIMPGQDPFVPPWAR